MSQVSDSTTTYAVMREGRKRAVKVYDTRAEAEAACAEANDEQPGHYVEERGGTQSSADRVGSTGSREESAGSSRPAPPAPSRTQVPRRRAWGLVTPEGKIVQRILNEDLVDVYRARIRAARKRAENPAHVRNNLHALDVREIEVDSE